MKNENKELIALLQTFPEDTLLCFSAGEPGFCVWMINEIETARHGRRAHPAETGCRLNRWSPR
jgi:hypothetical protein